MEGREIDKAVVHNIAKIIEYVTDKITIKSILEKTTGSIRLFSLDAGETLTEKIIPFDTFILIIDGKAEIVIDGKSNLLGTGSSIIIPAHNANFIKANERFKMISTVIKNGYE